MKDSDILRAAKKLISTPERWTKGSLARTRWMNPVTADDPNAVRFCMLGALARVVGGQDYYAKEGQYRCAVYFLYEVLGRSISGFNDDENTTHADVLAAFDRAIKLAEEPEE